MEQAKHPADRGDRSFMARLTDGEYGLAITYWVLYLIGAATFFFFGSRAVDAERWVIYLGYVVAMLVYTLLLIIGVRAAYEGPQLWKVMSRTSSIFMIINILVAIATLGFVY